MGAAMIVVAFVVFLNFIFVFGDFSIIITRYQMMIIKRGTNTIYGIHLWNPGLEFSSLLILR
jgi:hypothetical protein